MPNPLKIKKSKIIFRKILLKQKEIKSSFDIDEHKCVANNSTVKFIILLISSPPNRPHQANRNSVPLLLSSFCTQEPDPLHAKIMNELPQLLATAQ